jgi:hypothetical protein
MCESPANFDPVCLIHGQRKSEHFCLYCGICYKPLTIEECNINDEGHKEDVCVPCANMEKRAMELKKRLQNGDVHFN